MRRYQLGYRFERKFFRVARLAVLKVFDHAADHRGARNRVCAYRGFRGENQPVSAVQKRIVNVVDFCPRRIRRSDHGFKKVRRHIDRYARAAASAQNGFLGGW